MIDQLPGLTVGLLCLTGFVAGWIDAVVGGGGVIQLPGLLIGLPASTPVATISGTNKLSSVAGTAMAAGTYVAKVKIAWPITLGVIVTAFAGSSLGAHLVQYLPRTAFWPIMVIVVGAVGVYTWRRPALGLTTALKHHGATLWALALGLGLVVGLWDGMVGPGTGVFLVIGFVGLLGYGFLEATAMTKLTNLATNLAALIVLGSAGHILWQLGAVMAGANFAGGAIGARMTLRHGNGFIRRVFLVAVTAVEVKLIYDTVRLFV